MPKKLSFGRWSDRVQWATHGKLSIFSGEGQFMTSPGFWWAKLYRCLCGKVSMFWGQIKPHQATSSHITLHSLVQNPSDPEISGAGEESILEEEEMVKVVALGKLYKMMTGFTGKLTGSVLTEYLNYGIDSHTWKKLYISGVMLMKVKSAILLFNKNVYD